MNINLAYLELRLSGGASNTLPGNSLGGVMSSQRVYSKSVSGISNVLGVTLDDAPGCPDGTGTLTWDATAETLTWTPFGGTAGEAVSVTEDGRYAIPGSVGFLMVTVDYSGLPAQNESDSIVVTQLANQLFDDITKDEALAGESEYRCVYIHNAHPTDKFINAALYIGAQPVGNDVLAIALDLAGVGNGSSTGVADTIADEGTAPSPPLTFAAPATAEAGLSVSELVAGAAVAFWQRRTVPANTLTPVAADLSQIVIKAWY